jgi:hypothetical protein
MIAGMERAGAGGSGGGSLEIDDDGTWRVRRLSGSERAGRFGDRLDGAALEAVKAEVAEAAAAGPPSRDEPWRPGGLVDSFWAGDVVAQIGADEEPPAAWEGLARRCRALLDGAAEMPIATIEADATGDGELRHAGTEPVPTNGAGFSVEATVFGPGGSTHDSWTGTIEAPQEIPPGWQASLGLDGSGLVPAAGQTIGVTVRFAFVDGLPRPAMLWAST